jgi:hypothetical protein
LLTLKFQELVSGPSLNIHNYIYIKKNPSHRQGTGPLTAFHDSNIKTQFNFP